jgi:predicted nucleic acid-binding protein
MAVALLDSDAVIDLLRGIEPSVELLRSVAAAGDTLGICDVVLAEVFAGLRPEDRAAVASVLAGFAYLRTSAEAARQAGEWRHDFARKPSAPDHRKRGTLPDDGANDRAAAAATSRDALESRPRCSARVVSALEAHPSRPIPPMTRTGRAERHPVCPSTTGNATCEATTLA